MNKSVVLIPDWVESSLMANDIDLRKLAEYGHAGAYNEFIKLASGVSVYDLAELYVANDKLYRKLFGAYNTDTMGQFININIWSYVTNKLNVDKENDKLYIDLLNNLNNGTILVSDTNVVNKPTYSFKQHDNTLFVVLHNGFSNFAVTGKEVNKDIFIRDLIDKMFEIFGEYDAVTHSITEKYVRNR